MDTTSSSRNLGGTFNQLFELKPALDKASIEQVYRIRHDVYCRDLGWEPVREDGMETDGYDAQSVHCLLRRRDTGAPVGCTRLILTRPADLDAPLPFEQNCKDVIDRSLVDPSLLPRHTMAEVSRLAVVSAFRQRKGEGSTAIAVNEEDFESRAGMPRFPFIPVGLYLGVLAISKHLGLEDVFVLTEPRLASHFTRIGFHLQVVGGAIEHHGARVPSMMRTRTVLAGLRPLIKPLYEVIQDSVDTEFRAHPDLAPKPRAR